MELAVIAIVGLVATVFIFRPVIAGQIAAGKIVEQQHLVANEEMISDTLEAAGRDGQLTRALGLFDDVRKAQGDGTVRVGQVVWVMMKLDGSTEAPLPTYQTAPVRPTPQ